MKMKIRYSMAPQMREYDTIGHSWVPYLMYFHTAGYSSAAVNTDPRGFRIVYRGEERISPFGGLAGSDIGLIVGGSTAFGVGATNDRQTLPSILNSLTDCLWLNFGGRAFSSTQEFLLFLFYRHMLPAGRVKKIIIFSGINNLILHHIARRYPKDLGPFFFWNQYNKSMNASSASLKRKIFNLMTGRAAETKVAAWTAAPEDMLNVLRRDISNWKIFAGSQGMELYYVLQPLADWVKKELSREEAALFAELDTNPQNIWRALKEATGGDTYAWFRGRMREMCRENSIPFLDMNEALSKRRLDGKWLFVDRAHFTDEGYRIAAAILKEEVLK